MSTFSYPVPFRISTIRTEEYGMVEIVTSQYQHYNGMRCYETCLFWGTDGESHDVTKSFNREVAAKNHYKTSDEKFVVKEIKKHYQRERCS